MENEDVFSNADVHEVNKWLNQKKSEFSFEKMQFERKKLPVTKCSLFLILFQVTNQVEDSDVF